MTGNPLKMDKNKLQPAMYGPLKTNLFAYNLTLWACMPVCGESNPSSGAPLHNN